MPQTLMVILCNVCTGIITNARFNFDSLFCLWKLLTFHIIKTLFDGSIIELVLIFFFFLLCVFQKMAEHQIVHTCIPPSNSF